MKIAVLCEGNYDVRLLGYYIHKISEEKWSILLDKNKVRAIKAAKIPLEFSDKVEVYSETGNDNNYLILWPVNGKSKFSGAIEDICRLNMVYPEDMFDKIVIIADRDEDSIEGKLAEFDEMFAGSGWNDTSLKNGIINKYDYITADGEENHVQVDIVPIIVPFEEKGAMETVLINSLAAASDENNFIVEEAKTYIEGICADSRVTTYLSHKGEQVKAKYSAVIAVMNPTHGSFTYDQLLVSHDWEKSPVFEKHFGVLREVI